MKNKLKYYFDISFIPANKAKIMLKRAFSNNQRAFILYYKKKYIFALYKFPIGYYYIQQISEKNLQKAWDSHKK